MNDVAMRTACSLLMVLMIGVGVTRSETMPVNTQSIYNDWAEQDGLYDDVGALRPEAVIKPIEAIGESGKDLRTRYDQLLASQTPADDARWIELYREAAMRRRVARLAPWRDVMRRVVFTKHYNLGGSHYAYTEGQSDAQKESNFHPGSALCVFEFDGEFGRIDTLLADSAGVIRDPEVSYDGRRILFAWKKSKQDDDYHLYEMTVADRSIRQLTDTPNVADYEACYLPDGRIMFNSTRCVQTVDCWWTEVSNLYTCDANGQNIRRIAYDQVHTNYPTVTPDGRVIYTRWDYSDRGQLFPQGLFQMNADGTAQTACYGNNSWFPTTILHARAIPGTSKIVAIFTGHHTRQQGQLGLLDPSQGREENSGAQLIAPVRDTPAERIDRYGQKGPQFQYPYPLSESAFIVAMDPRGGDDHRNKLRFGIYWVDRDGRRELLVDDETISCNQPIPLADRQTPHLAPSRVDPFAADGVYYVQDVYTGPGLAGVKRGTIKKLRVVAIDYRAAGIGSNHNGGPAGGALVSTPVSVGNGCWDPKTILGEATVYEDGSACFAVPAHTPVYFQAIDENGFAAQTMRSWSTLQPGETFSCVGCHESKNDAPPQRRITTAMQRGPQELDPFHKVTGGFSYAKHVQPILDRRCVSCHDDVDQSIAWDRKADQPVGDVGRAFALTGKPVDDLKAKRQWSQSYLTLTRATRPDPPADQPNRRESFTGRSNRLVNWISVQSVPTMLEPYHAGAARSGLIELLKRGHGGVTLDPAEIQTLAAWIDLLVPYCGDYIEANLWAPAEREKYEHFLRKRQRLAASYGQAR
ncbi:hypothetical protein HED60_19605 [Planctomycetales bacterium ZRK34]|nr:hypothetical protein HED60_19605 [Planctomycetales bacterium ZRK34]